jgi:hypothetical protein
MRSCLCRRDLRIIVAAGWSMPALCLAFASCAPRIGRHAASPTITVTGCVQNHGAGSSATMDGGYMLTATVTGNAQEVPRSSPGSRGPAFHDDAPNVGGQAQPATPSNGQSTGEMAHHESESYMLDGRDSELRILIDKRAEITGTLETHWDEPGDSNSTPTKGSAIPHGRASGLQWLRVASVKVISSDCSAQRPD